MDKEEIEIETNTEDLEHQGEEPEGAHEAGGEVDPGEGADLNPESGAEGDEVEVSIGGEPDPQAEEERKAPQWVRDLRKQNRELARQNRELEQRIAKRIEEGQSAVMESLLGCPMTLEAVYDGLDRVRINDLDVRYLRNPQSMRLAGLANELLAEI